MKALFEHFPEERIHCREMFRSASSNRRLQRRLIRALHDLNCRTFTFEQIGNPTIPECTVIFEVGIADANNFTFIDEDEARKILIELKEKPLKVMDFFFVIRYYKEYGTKRNPLKFDYYMTRFVFAEEGRHEVQIFHERGPRYIPPKDLIVFLKKSVSEPTAGKT